MRKSLFTAAAVAPLLIALGAHAATTINTATTSPVVTSAVEGGASDELTIASGGSVTITDGVGVTIDTNTDFTNNGSVTVNGDASGNTGVLVTGPYVGSIDNNDGAIVVNETYEAEDTNGDGVLDGPFSKAENRYGLRILDSFTGSLKSEGSITVKGNHSSAVSIEGLFTGDIDLNGIVTVTGSNSKGLNVSGPVDGSITLDGTMNIFGEHSLGADISGDVSGSLRIYSVINASGFRQINRSADPDAVAELLPENLLVGGPAVQITGDVAKGVFIGQAPAADDDDGDGNTTGEGEDDDHDDVDQDGIVDSIEGSAALSVYGSAPALLVAADTADTHLGVFGTGSNAYGLIINGKITASGVYDGFDANAVQVGGLGSGGTIIDGGIRVGTGVLSATALQADATTIHLMQGAQTPILRNEGSIGATSASDEDNTATALLIDAGASLPNLHNQGVMQASAIGDTASAYGVVDLSGTLSNVVNTGYVLTNRSAATEGATPVGQAVAFDLSHNTTGVTFVQDPNPNSTDELKVTPIIRGDILLGSGNDSVTLNSGTVTGALDFGAGTGVLAINNGASYSGALTSSGSLDIAVNDGLLDNRSAAPISASALTVGSAGEIRFGVDPAANTVGRIEVAGVATLEDGAKLGVSILSLPTGTQTYNIIQAGTLDVQGDPGALLGTTPYLVVAGLDVDQPAGSVDLTVRRRTAEEAGFNRSEAGAYDAVYENIGRDKDILSVFLAQGDQAGLINAYDQMLPDHAGGVLRSLSWAQEGANRAAADWPRAEESSGPTRAWTQEIGLGEHKNRDAEAAWNAYAFGFAGGLESVSANGSALGAMVTFTTGNVSNPDTPGDDLVGASQLGAGVYWRQAFGGLRADVGAGAGFAWFNSRRELIDNSTGVVVRRQTEADWTGWSAYARAGLAYEWKTGRFVIRPATSLDYFRLSEAGYEESGGGTGFDLEVDDRSSDVLAWTSTMTLGYSFGDKTIYRPEFTFGWRQVLAGSGGTTTGNFVGSTTPFELFGEPLDGGAPIVRAGLRVYSSWLDLLIDGGAEFRDDYTDLDLRLTARIVF